MKIMCMNDAKCLIKAIFRQLLLDALFQSYIRGDSQVGLGIFNELRVPVHFVTPLIMCP